MDKEETLMRHKNTHLRAQLRRDCDELEEGVEGIARRYADLLALADDLLAHSRSAKQGKPYESGWQRLRENYIYDTLRYARIDGPAN